MILSDLNAALRNLFRHNGSELAGYIAYTALVSLFPFTIFLFAVAGFFREELLAQNLLSRIMSALPAQVADTLLPIARDILSGKQPTLLTVGALGTLWATFTGVEALRLALNRAYETHATRPIWKRYAEDAFIVIAAAVTGLLASALIVAAPLILQPLQQHGILLPGAIRGLNLGRYLLTYFLLTLFLSAAYKLLPALRQRWRRVLPGALLASAVWLLLATLFSLYLAYFNRYNLTYGSLGGVVITLLFMQLSAMIFIFGAEFNAAGSRAANS